jgi:hypothetical protein
MTHKQKTTKFLSETYRDQIRRLGNYLLLRYGTEINEGGAVDNAIRILEEHRMSALERLAAIDTEP